MEKTFKTTKDSQIKCEYNLQLLKISLFDQPLQASSNSLSNFDHQKFNMLFFKYNGSPENINFNNHSIEFLIHETKNLGLAIKKKESEEFTISDLFNKYGNGNIIEVRGGSSKLDFRENNGNRKEDDPTNANKKIEEAHDPSSTTIKTNLEENKKKRLRSSDFHPPKLLDSNPIVSFPPHLSQNTCPSSLQLLNPNAVLQPKEKLDSQISIKEINKTAKKISSSNEKHDKTEVEKDLIIKIDNGKRHKSRQNYSRREKNNRLEV